jgi:hypothetical protein
VLGIRPWDWHRISEREGTALMAYIDARFPPHEDD